MYVSGKLIATADVFSRAPLIETGLSNILSVAEVLSEKCSVRSLLLLNKKFEFIASAL